MIVTVKGYVQTIVKREVIMMLMCIYKVVYVQRYTMMTNPKARGKTIVTVKSYDQRYTMMTNPDVNVSIQGGLSIQ